MTPETIDVLKKVLAMAEKGELAGFILAVAPRGASEHKVAFAVGSEQEEIDGVIADLLESIGDAVLESYSEPEEEGVLN